MELTKLSLKRPVSTVIVIAAIVIFGIMSIMQMNMQLTPDMEMPMFIVYTTYVGVSPEDIDELVSKKIEDAGGTLKGIKNIECMSYENYSMVLFQYDYGTDMDDAYMDLLEQINVIKSDLPEDCAAPVIMELNMNQLPTITISVAAEGDINLLNYVQDDVVPEIEKITDVAKVDVSGGEEAYISVTLDQNKMNQYGLTMSNIVTYINAASFTMPVGTADYGKSALNVSISAEYDTIAQLLAIPITTNKGQVIQLSDVATITQKNVKSDSISRYNGLDDVTISVQKRQSAGDVSVVKQVRKTIDKLQTENAGVKFEVISDSSESVKSSLKSVAETLVLGMVLSMFILFLFFGDIKGSLIVGCSMPISVLLTFILMYFCGFSLNVVTMGAMVIGVGMMVDNSIVVLESCFRMRDRNLDYKESALSGTKYVMNSIVASTLTTVVVYLPIALSKGLSGQIFKPLGFTICFSLLASLFSAITLVPLFFSKYKPVEKKKSPTTRLLLIISDKYSIFLRKILRVKFLAAFIAVIMLGLAIFGATLLHVELLPSSDSGHIQLKIEGRPGLNVEEYDKFMTELEEMVSKDSDVKKYSLSASSSQANGSLDVYLFKDRVRETWEIAEEWKLKLAGVTSFDVSIAEISDTQISGMDTSAMTSDGTTVSVTLMGSNLEDLKEAAIMVENEMKTIPGVISTDSDNRFGGSKAKIVIDSLKAANVGFTPAVVAGHVNMALSGVDTIEITNNRKQYTVKVEYPEGTYENVTDLNELSMISPTGKNVLLSDISDIVYTDSPLYITRYNGKYMTYVYATTVNEGHYDVEDEIKKRVDNLVFPGDVGQGQDTADEMLVDELTTLAIAVIVAFLLVLMLMAMQFESIRFSVMVMWCVPFALIGSIGLMLLTGTTISMVAMMGILTLIGTVVNNGILYVDTVNQMREEMCREDALVEAGRIRLRPILMTSLTTILAMIPMSLGIGEGTEMMQSMGIVIIGGFVASTFLTLLLLPVFYVIMDNLRGKKKRNEFKDMELKFRMAKLNEGGSNAIEIDTVSTDSKASDSEIFDKTQSSDAKTGEKNKASDKKEGKKHKGDKRNNSEDSKKHNQGKNQKNPKKNKKRSSKGELEIIDLDDED